LFENATKTVCFLLKRHEIFEKPRHSDHSELFKLS